jgi:hypothetical protein
MAAARAMAGQRHVVMLGDSIFDNAAYIAGGPDVRFRRFNARQRLRWQCSTMQSGALPRLME